VNPRPLLPFILPQMYIHIKYRDIHISSQTSLSYLLPTFHKLSFIASLCCKSLNALALLFQLADMPFRLVVVPCLCCLVCFSSKAILVGGLLEGLIICLAFLCVEFLLEIAG
jgi:hypothetical protein